MARRGRDNVTVRIDYDLWERFGATLDDTDRSTVIRDFIRWWVREPDTKMPRRPGAPTRERLPGTP